MSELRYYRSIQRVYFDDLDALNILHNVRYQLFLERARGELFHALGYRWEDPLEQNPDKISVVAENRIVYRRPVRGEGKIAVLIGISHLGRTSLIADGRVESMDGGLLYAEGSTRMVRLDPTTYRPCPWSGGFRESIEAYQGGAPLPHPDGE